MKRQEIARRLACEQRLPRAVARDQVDEIVHKILKKLQNGEPVEIPGLGKLIPQSARPKTR